MNVITVFKIRLNNKFPNEHSFIATANQIMKTSTVKKSPAYIVDASQFIIYVKFINNLPLISSFNPECQ